MKQAQTILSKDFIIGRTEDRLFGSFVEHMGSVVYNGIYEPTHPSSDEDGFRTDVLSLVSELKLAAVRYPGGNFTSGYMWEDGIGPKELRRAKTDAAWKQIEPNTFGLNEFMKWLGRVDAEAIMTINLGTRGIEEAKNIVEYCNFEGAGVWSDLRRAHGIDRPYGIRTWCLGNELDGEWQIARKTADEYGKLACETAKVMKWIDPSIELVAVGSSATHMSTYPEWDRQVLMNTYDQVEYLSLHHYIGKKEADTPAYLAMSLGVEHQIRTVIAACDYVQSVKRSKKTMMLSFDEWNVWREPDLPYTPWQTGCPFDWVQFRMEDALVFGSMMLAIIRNADRIKIACQSLLVNTIPMILTRAGGPAWRNATFYPFLHVSRYGRGEVLRLEVSSPKYDTASYTDVPFVDSAAVYRAETGELTVFAVNRAPDSIAYKMDIRDFPGLRLVEHLVMNHERLDAKNTEEHMLEVAPRSVSATTLDGSHAESVLPSYSWNVIRFRTE